MHFKIEKNNKNLKYYEDTIHSNLKEIDLLGDISLSEDVMSNVVNLFKELISNDTLERLRKYPCTLSLFLVWEGILKYDGDYWKYVAQYLDQDENDNKWMNFIGDVFLQCLSSNGLPKFENLGTKYVTPILIHGYICDKDVPNFFEKFLVPFYHHYSIDEKSVSHQLRTWRKESERHNELKAKEEKLEDQLIKINRQLKKDKIALKNWGKVKKVTRLEDKLINNEYINYLLDKPKNYLDQKEKESESKAKDLDYIKNKLSKLYTIQKVLYLKRNIYNKQNKLFINKKIHLWSFITIVRIFSNLTNQDNRSSYNNIANANPNEIKSKIENVVGKEAEEKKNNDLFNLNLILFSNFNNFPNSLPSFFKYFIPKQFYNNIIELKNLYLKYLSFKEKLIEKHNVNKIKDSLNQINNKIEQKIIKKEQIANELRIIKQDIGKYKKYIRSAGRGLISEGQKILSEQRNFHTELNKQRNKIASNINIEQIKDYIFEYSYEGLRNKVENQTEKLDQIKDELDKVDKELDKSPDHFSQLNKATKYFLFYNNTVSINFVSKLLSLLKALIKNDKNRIKSISIIPRMSRKLKNWFQENKGRIVDNTDTRNNFKSKHSIIKPSIKLDRINEQIYVDLPIEKVKISSPKQEYAIFKIYNKKHKLISEEKIDVLDWKGKGIRTESNQTILKNPSDSYRFKFIYENFTKEWEQEGLIQNSYLLFDKRHRQMPPSLVSSEFWIVIYKDHRIEPKSVIKREIDLCNDWKDFKLLYINLDSFDLLNIFIGLKLINTLSKNYDIEPHLSEKNLIKNAFVKHKDENYQIYINEPPILVFSVEDSDKLDFWEMKIEENNITENWIKLNSLKENILIGNGIVQIPLNIVLSEKFGNFKIILRKRKRRIDNLEKYVFNFVVVPSISISFDKKRYLPKLKKSDRIVTITSNTRISFGLDCSAKIIKSSDWSYKLNFNEKIEKITGVLKYLEYNKINNLHVIINIPVVKWKIIVNGKEIVKWTKKIKTIWYKKLYANSASELKVEIPGLSEKIYLHLSDKQTIKPKKITKDTATFDLYKLKSQLDNTSKAQEIVDIELKEALKSHRFHLFSIQAQWEINNLKITQKTDCNKRLIMMNWDEVGTVHTKIVRFWRVMTKGLSEVYNKPIFEKKIDSSKYNINLSISKSKLPYGKYRIEFAEYNPWMKKETHFPKKSVNTTDKIIGHKDEVIDSILKYGLKIMYIKTVKGKKLKMRNDYYINNIEYLSETEELFQGEVYYANKRGNNYIAFNPVKFHINCKNRTIPFLIDKEQDGVQYCTKCKELFWEYRKKHRKLCRTRFDIIFTIKE